jgi:glutamine synthetase
MLAAGLEGIAKKYPLRDPTERNVYEMTKEERKKHRIDSLPGNLYEAIQVTEESELVKKALGEDIFYKFIDNKKIEWERYRAQVTDYELNEYFSIL